MLKRIFLFVLIGLAFVIAQAASPEIVRLMTRTTDEFYLVLAGIRFVVFGLALVAGMLILDRQPEYYTRRR